MSLSLSLPHKDDEVWKSWDTFLARLWFRRIWVIQEFALAAIVTMICGTVTFHFEVLWYVICGMERYRFRVGSRYSYESQNLKWAASRSRGSLGVLTMAKAR
jgi:hypothetical protein